MFDPTQAMESLQYQIDKMVKEFAETKDLEKRVQLSQVIKNLSDSVGVYLNFAAGMAASFDEDDFGDEFEDD